MKTLDRVVVQILPHVPRGVVRRVSSRYIAGTSLADALPVVQRLQAKGVRATVDILGEFIRELDESRRAAAAYLELVDTLWRERLDAQVSVKLTALGLQLDRPTCRAHLQRIVRAAAAHGRLVTIDMEDSSCTDATLELYRGMRAETPYVGAVLQASLRRSRDDLEALLPLGPNIRVCKGIYVEPESIAFQDRDEIRQSFLDLVGAMLNRTSFVGIATHDDWLVDRCRELIERSGAGRDRYEFQMLLGVREGLRERLVRGGHPVRVYVPYGEHWYAYSLRRLKENPAVAGHVLRNLMHR